MRAAAVVVIGADGTSTASERSLTRRMTTVPESTMRTGIRCLQVRLRRLERPAGRPGEEDRFANVRRQEDVVELRVQVLLARVHRLPAVDALHGIPVGVSGDAGEPHPGGEALERGA